MIPRPIASFLERHLKNIPVIKKKIDSEIDTLMKEVESSLKPYKDISKTHVDLPELPISREDIIHEIKSLNAKEETKWKDGFASGAVYHGDQEHIDFQNRVYAITSQINPLHSDLWPSASKYESEIVQMTANMLSKKVKVESL